MTKSKMVRLKAQIEGYAQRGDTPNQIVRELRARADKSEIRRLVNEVSGEKGNAVTPPMSGIMRQ